MAVGLFVPILAGLFTRRPSPAGALAAIVAGVVIVGGLQFATGGAGVAGFTPAMLGLLGAFGAYVRRREQEGRSVEGRQVRSVGVRSQDAKLSAGARSSASAERRAPSTESSNIPCTKSPSFPETVSGRKSCPRRWTSSSARRPGVLSLTEFPWGCEFYHRNGRMMEPDGLDQLQQFDAIFLGAIGDPRVPDHISVWELILPLRQRFDQYVNLRPMRLMPGVTGPLAGPHRRGHRHGLRARELGRGVRRARRPAARRHAARGRRADRHLHAPRHRAHRALRVRGGVAAPAPQAGQRDQVERAAALDGAVGHGRRGGGEGLSRRSSGASTTSTRWRRA